MTLLRVDGETEGAVTGTKGYKWAEYSVFKVGNYEVDWTYYDELYNKAYDQIAKYGDPEWFLS